MEFVCLLAVVVGIAVLFFKNRAARRRAEEALAASERSLAELRQAYSEGMSRYGALEAAFQSAQQDLTRFRPIVDVEAYAAEVRANADQHWYAAQAEVQNLRTGALAQAAESRAEAERRWAAAQAEVQRLQAQTTAERDAILTRAHEEAHRIAGEALDALKQKKELEHTLQALRNTINGYGLDYLTPSFGLLEELGEQYEFAQAGAQLKAAIARAKSMVRTGGAAQCDYVEANRRLTAIAFAIDAFNGKVDSALASVKHDNYGVLQQEIRDGFQMVNHLGEAFRNARIVPAYLQAQLDVLKWAVAVHELKVREREEQRAIRERMREEAKAAKEYERALREAAKDEESARRAVEKALADMAKAENEAQRAKLEAKLAELTSRLEAAEEKGRRALSMAQQTKAGHVYVISNVGSFGEDVLKIGMTRRLEPLDRVKELGDASVPFEFDVHTLIRSEDAPALERDLHRAFLDCQVNKVNPRKEFFRVDLAKVKAAVEERGLQTSWTIAAAAREWRESQALEKRLRTDAGARAEWERAQAAEMERSLAEELAGGADERDETAAAQ